MNIDINKTAQTAIAEMDKIMSRCEKCIHKKTCIDGANFKIAKECKKFKEKNTNMKEKPTRCVDPVMKYCQGCKWGYVHYPEWVETREDLAGCMFESGCTLGFDKGRPEDEPTEDELRKFDEWRMERIK